MVGSKSSSGARAGIEIQVKVDGALLRPADVTLQIPSYKKFHGATGWEPQIPYRQTLQDMLDYWRQEVQG